MSPVNFQLLPDSALVRQRDLLPILPFSAATLWRRVRAKQFPQPIRVSDSITAWKWGDVSEWLDARGSRFAEREAEIKRTRELTALPKTVKALQPSVSSTGCSVRQPFTRRKRQGKTAEPAS